MLQSFFIICSGADKNILKTCSDHEKTKYVGIGATIFFTAIMAFIASSFALYTIFENSYTSIIFGLIWGLLIFNLDRFIVSTLRKREKFYTEFLQALPRLILAIIIAIVISKPLELKIFEKEINTALLENQNKLIQKNKGEIAKYFESDITKNESKIDSLKSEIKAKENQVNNLYKIYIEEAEGISGTKKLGKGPVYKDKIEKYNSSKTEFDSLKSKNELKIAELEKEIKIVNEKKEDRIAKSNPIIENADGLMARIDALNTLSWAPSFFIMLLFLAIETAPIFVKLISSKSEYDFKIEKDDELLMHQIDQTVQESRLKKQTNNQINQKIYNEMDENTDLITVRKEEILNNLKN